MKLTNTYPKNGLVMVVLNRSKLFLAFGQQYKKILHLGSWSNIIVDSVQLYGWLYVKIVI